MSSLQILPALELVHGEVEAQQAPNALPTSSFTCKRINQSTFLIIEDDAFNEQPYIYVKIYPNRILITDTGCNSPKPPHRTITYLRQYIENYPLPINGGQPLNPNGNKSYIILCTHCHYDHILGIPQFASVNTEIIASSNDKDFLRNLGRNSLCDSLGTPTPEYKITYWAAHLGHFVSEDGPLRVQFLHVPGHTPDSLAWYDIDEHHLYVGDTFYQRIPELAVPGSKSTPLDGAIIFPNEGGNLIDFMASLDMLLSFTRFQNAKLARQNGYELTKLPSKGHVETNCYSDTSNRPQGLIAPSASSKAVDWQDLGWLRGKRVKVACGHNTFDADAEAMIGDVQDFFQRIIAGKIPAYAYPLVRGVENTYYLEKNEWDVEYSARVPDRLLEDARMHFHSRWAV